MTDLLWMIWRRLPLMLTIIVLGVLLSFYSIGKTPRVYEAAAVIQIDASAVVDPSSDSSLPASRRVQLIEQRLMSSSNIREIIKDLDLFEDAPALRESDKINALRASTRIESITNPGVSAESRLSLSGIVITAQAGQPTTAAAIANYFASSLVNRDRENRLARIVAGREYLAGQERSLSNALSELDREIVAYSNKHEDALPTIQENLQSELANLNESDNAIDREIMALQRDRLDMVSGGSAGSSRSSSTLVQQIRNAEVDLNQARRTLAPNHPEIKRLEENLKRLSVGGAEAVSDIVRRQIELIDAQLVNLHEQKVQLDRRRKEIEAGRAQAPKVAQQLDAMSREQSRLQDRYAEISRQLAQVETQQLLMDNDQTERFVMLERAQPPEYPVASSRKKQAALRLIASTAIACGVAFLLELMNPVLRSGEQFARITGTRPVISLPYRRSRRDTIVKWTRVVYMTVLVVGGAFLALWFVGKIPGMQPPWLLPNPLDGVS